MSETAYRWIMDITMALGAMMRRGGNDFKAIDAFLEVNRPTLEVAR